MGKIIMVTGGARSGKSSFAESLAKRLGDKIIYIATSIPFDMEMELRIQKHRERRPKGWTTFEIYKDFEQNLRSSLEKVDGVMLDCITIMVTNLMLEKEINWADVSKTQITETEEGILGEIDKLLRFFQGTPLPLILVTNEVGMGIVPENKLTRVFRDIAGKVNQSLAKVSDEVYLCVSGIPVKIK